MSIKNVSCCLQVLHFSLCNSTLDLQRELKSKIYENLGWEGLFSQYDHMPHHIHPRTVILNTFPNSQSDDTKHLLCNKI